MDAVTLLSESLEKQMKKKLLPMAMLAGLAGAVGTAQAAHVNPDGLGKVLIYPYYTAIGATVAQTDAIPANATLSAAEMRKLDWTVAK